MPIRKSFCLLSLTAVVVSAGCSSTRPASGLDRLFARAEKAEKNAIDDPLVGDKSALSNEFKSAQKGLDEPEKAQLAFARWKEDMGQYAEAKQRYREILTANPDNLSARLGIARIEFATGRSSEAAKILQAAAERSPNSAEVWVELGRIQSQQDAWDDAIASFQKASDINNNDQVARYELGIAYARAGQLNQALPHLEYAVGESAAFYNIGYVLNEQNQSRAAADWFRRALSAHPDDRTKAQAEQMLARTGANPALRGVAQVPAAQNPPAAANFRPAAAAPAAQMTGGRLPGRVLEASVATADHQADRSVQPPVTASQTGFATYGSQEANAESYAVPVGHQQYSADGSATPPQWNGPQRSVPQYGNSNSSSAVQPQQWRTY